MFITAYIPSFRNLQPLSGILGAVLCLGAALTLMKTRKRMVRRILFCLGAGFLCSLPVASGLSAGSWAGFPEPCITALRGTTTSDSRLLPDGRYTDRCRITRVYDKAGMSASGGGTVTVFSRRDETFYQGTEVEFSGSFVRTEGGESLFFVKGDSRVIADPEGLYRLRYRLIAFAVDCFATLKNEAPGLLTALFLGIRDSLADQHLFRQAGCSHLLALSGMHVGIITGFLALMLRPVLGKRISILFLYAVILAYLFLTGFGASLNRSAIMFVLLSAPSYFSKKPPPFQILCLSFIILSIISPTSTAGLSFQLSFLALGGILVFGKLTLPLLSFLPSPLRYPLSASLGAQLATAPLAASVFGIIYPVGILSSIILTPVVTLLMGLGMVFLGLHALGLSIAAFPLSYCMEALTAILYRIARGCAYIPGIEIAEGSLPFCIAGSAIITVLFLGYGMLRKRRFHTHREHKLRFPRRHSSFSEGKATMAQEAVRSEFSGESGYPGKTG